MKYIFTIIGSVVITVTLVAFFFNLNQVNQEKATLTINLEQRATLLADSLKESVEPLYTNSSQESLQTSLQKTVNKFANRERLAGIALYNNKGTLLATSSGLPKTIIENTKSISNAMDSNSSKGIFTDADGESRYVFVDPLHSDDENTTIIGALMIVQNAGYINISIGEIWKDNLLRLSIQIIIFSITIFIILRFFVFRQLTRLIDSIRKTRMEGKSETFQNINKFSFFKPLAKEIAHMSNSLSQARLSASEEARMRMEKIDTPWTAERLKEFTKAYLKDRQIFVVSNREPYIHTKFKNKINYSMTAHGMVTAIEPMLKACGGLWLAHGSGNADKETSDQDGKIAVPPEDPKYTLKRVWLSDEDIEGYYVGFANEALYPLCLHTHTRPIFRKKDWLSYKKVNEIFAQNLLTEIKDISQPIILIQDFHFSLLPQMIKTVRPDAQIALFWHITWPSAEQFSICPWREEILKGMLGADLVGFHTQQHCNNFLDTVGKEIEALIDFDRFSVTQDNHISYIKPLPVSVPFTDNLKNSKKPNRRIFDKLKVETKYVGLGVDRLDYTKGIIERLKGIETFLESYPTYQKQFTFIQIAPGDREVGEKNREYQILVTKEVKRINDKFKTDEWEPILLDKNFHSHEELEIFYKLSDFCLVTSLHDGMNLVAKEFVSARNDELGMVILSKFAGASRDLKGAIIVNPYSAEGVAESIHEALSMPPIEQHRRMKTMRDSVKNYNTYRWAAELIRAVVNL